MGYFFGDFVLFFGILGNLFWLGLGWGWVGLGWFWLVLLVLVGLVGLVLVCLFGLVLSLIGEPVCWFLYLKVGLFWLVCFD